MRIAGIVLLVLAALIVVPALSWWAVTSATHGDEMGIVRAIAVRIVALGVCVGGIGGAAVFVSRRAG